MPGHPPYPPARPVALVLLVATLAGCYHRADDAEAMEKDFEACKALIEQAAHDDFDKARVSYATAGTYRIDEDNAALIEIDLWLQTRKATLAKSALCTLPLFSKPDLVLTDPAAPGI